MPDGADGVGVVLGLITSATSQVFPPRLDFAALRVASMSQRSVPMLNIGGSTDR
ncbi:MAG: hypothetical protein HRU17_18645 [Polyangiaceae bacterium]|nr:hypothetical protein [Polyangiaceae bacterium]